MRTGGRTKTALGRFRRPGGETAFPHGPGGRAKGSTRGTGDASLRPVVKRSQKPDARYAVLTGDIVDSRHLAGDQLDQVRASLGEAVDEMRSWQRGLVRGKLAFFRGDSWQLLLAHPGPALRAAVFLRARLIASGLADTRLSVGIGTVENVTARNVTRSTGEAFSLSGEGLDAMKDPLRLAISLSPADPCPAGLFSVVGKLCDALMSEWTQRQAEIVSLAADPAGPIQETIAAALKPPVTRQAVSRSLSGAHWEAILATIRQFEKLSF